MKALCKETGRSQRAFTAAAWLWERRRLAGHHCGIALRAQTSPPGKRRRKDLGIALHQRRQPFSLYAPAALEALSKAGRTQIFKMNDCILLVFR